MRKTTESWKAVANYYFELAKSYFRAHPRASEGKFLDREFPKLQKHLLARHWSINEIEGVWMYSLKSIKSGIRTARKSIAVAMATMGRRTTAYFKEFTEADFDSYMYEERIKFGQDKTAEGWTGLEIERVWIDTIPVMEKAREETLHSRKPWHTQTKPKQFVFEEREGKIVGRWK